MRHLEPTLRKRKTTVATAICLCAALIGCGGSEPDPLAAENEAREAAAKERDRKEGLSTLINLSGNLCASIEGEISRSDGITQVYCKEYRDPSKSKTKNNLIIYLINPQQGTIEIAGRG